MLEEAIGYTQIKTIRSLAFQSHQQNNWTYGIDRGAFGTDRHLYYEPNLPRFYEAQTDRWINLRIAFDELADQARDLGRRVRVLDIGCGTGRFSRDIKRRFKSAVELSGISAFDWRSKKDRQEDEKQNIAYIIHDAQRLARLRLEEFDCVVSCKTLLYLADPLVVVKRAYDVTRMGGFGFLNFEEMGRFFPKEDDCQKLIQFLKTEYGFSRDRRGFAFRRTREKLVLPVKYAGSQADEQGKYWLTYKTEKI